MNPLIIPIVRYKNPNALGDHGTAEGRAKIPDHVDLYDDGSMIAWHDTAFLETYGVPFADAQAFAATYGIDIVDLPTLWRGKPTKTTHFGCWSCNAILSVNDYGPDMHTAGCDFASMGIPQRLNATLDLSLGEHDNLVDEV